MNYRADVIVAHWSLMTTFMGRVWIGSEGWNA
jgi:hypothetical protein